ncbi:MAG: lipocalin family protein [Deltaproteobacteria bacterium]|nr:lipocalin family protein [Deltaproteobacteria bacterium]
MTLSSKMFGFAILLCLAAVCSSCLTASMPKSARMDDEAQSGPEISGPSAGNSDNSVVGKWELLYQINDKGERQNPKDQTKTQIEFTNNRQVIFNRFDNENSDSMKSRTGKYSVEKNQISITDDAGNTVKWPFQISGDSLIISMPEVNKKFHWSRVR